LVIHGISLPPGKFGGHAIDDLFGNNLAAAADSSSSQLQGLRVSAHVLIRRDAELTQYVSFNHAAWHAGESQFNNRSQCNDFSIGIELEGTDRIPYTPEQYQLLAKLTHNIFQAYPKITPETIVGHSDIAPNRKTDPGPSFDWDHYYQLLKGHNNEIG